MARSSPPAPARSGRRRFRSPAPATLAQAEAIARFKPSFYCGPAHHLKAILDEAAEAALDASSLKRGLVFGPFPAGLRNEFALRGVALRLAYATPELGLVGYESGTSEGLTLNEGLILELVEPTGGRLAAAGEPGELVVTRLNADYRCCGSAPAPSPGCYRTPPPAGARTRDQRAGRAARGRGRRILRHPSPFRADHEIVRRHPASAACAWCLRRAKGAGCADPAREHCGDGASLSQSLSETLHKITQRRGTIEFVSPGSLPDDEGVIVDERPLN